MDFGRDPAAHDFAEEWFQVFVQKVVRRVGIEVMSFFAALLESQLY